jgi:hypothetical protein
VSERPTRREIDGRRASASGLWRGVIALPGLFVACTHVDAPRVEPEVVVARPPAESAPPPVLASASSAPPASASAPPPVAPAPVVREEKRVVVDGVEERWRLEWASPPTLACVDPTEAYAFMCRPFAYGESGELSLVRARPGAPEDRLDLGRVVGSLPRWAAYPKDAKGSPPSLEEIRARPAVEIMKLGDYDHDGRATEFVLATSAGNPFGAYRSVVVGIRHGKERLHFFGTTALPDEPLVLEREGQWERVRAHVPVELTQVPCGDHGSPSEQTSVIAATPAGFDVTRRVYGCTPAGRTPSFVVRPMESCRGDGCY